jgi:hypothetical protein
MDAMQERVQRGIELLNAKVPGWVERINIDELNMAICARCVLGQLFEHFDRGRKELGIKGFEYTHGFDVERFATEYPSLRKE